ncbi:MAG TPA: sulfite exporter TauE/SafE family protein [Bacteroidales bacterium]|nr:sulfite exporter TauE/SafE family protein [Bacteroidales bacterium]
MEILLISVIAFVTAILTFFSGFGLGTILLPVFAVFFPAEVAVALTGVVHFSNNLFKATLVGMKADKSVLLRFGIPAVIASFAGAWLLLRITGMPALLVYELGSGQYEITPVKLTIAILLLVFSMLEILPFAQRLQFSREKMPLGGILSGFFGGLAGIQGAIRSAFLIRAGLSKESYIATGVVIACMVDITRLSVYVSRFRTTHLHENMLLVITAAIAAMAGAFLGNRLLKKVTLKSIQLLVAVLLILVSFALGAGLI